MAAMAARAKPDLYLVAEDDTVYEQDIARDRESVKPWLAYIEHKLQHGSLIEQAFVMERACRQLPRSYKLWKLVRCFHLSSRTSHHHKA